jgi:biopolymer transport protein ExbD
MMDMDIAIGDGRRKRHFSRAKRINIRVDMTPMVDLGFLLITFFVMTSRLREPVAMKLNMPKEDHSVPPTTVANSNALTILLDGNDRIYYYHGDWKDALASNSIFQTNYSATDGIGKVIREKQIWLDAHKDASRKEGRRGLVLLIKPGKDASYQNVIDALDETLINIVGKYAIVKMESGEIDWIKGHR